MTVVERRRKRCHQTRASARSGWRDVCDVASRKRRWLGRTLR